MDFIKHPKYLNIMKVKYDKEVDVMYVSFSDELIFESDEDKKGVILDYSADGRVVGIEILNASKQVGNPAKVEYEYA
jgi:uncharacterized protein YuzE